jgi:pimeloyl-ACP methyl ester carboxylesterase
MIAVFGVLGAAAWGLWSASNLILKGNRDPVAARPSDWGLPCEEVRFSSADGVEIAAWFVPAREGSGKTILFCHGWGANRGDLLKRTWFLARDGFNLFYLDMRNHGDSGSGLSSLSRYEAGDVSAALDWLKKNKPGAAEKLALYGMSLGAAVCLWVAAHRADVRGLVAESPFSSFNEVVRRYGKLFHHLPAPVVNAALAVTRRRLGFDPEDYSPVKVVGRIAPRPLFLIQGDRDARMPPVEGERLFAVAGEPKELWTVPEADHGEIWEKAGTAFEDRVRAFYKKVLG